MHSHSLIVWYMSIPIPNTRVCYREFPGREFPGNRRFFESRFPGIKIRDPGKLKIPNYLTKVLQNILKQGRNNENKLRKINK